MNTLGSSTFVTGGSSGIGAAVVRKLALQGHDVTFTYNRSADEANALERELREFGRGQVRAIAVDLSSPEAVAVAADSLASQDHCFSGFVHCAGISYDSLSMSGDLGRARALLEVNVWSMIAFYQRLIRPMMVERSGRIVLVGSIASERGNRGNAFYAMSKGALAAFMRCAADELAARGITINVVAPGYVNTRMMVKQRDMKNRIPARRYAEPNEIADLIGFLLSKEASYITGATLVADGGLTCTLGVTTA